MMSGQGMYTGSDGVIYSGTFNENAFYKGKCTFTNETGSYGKNLAWKPVPLSVFGGLRGQKPPNRMHF